MRCFVLQQAGIVPQNNGQGGLRRSRKRGLGGGLGSGVNLDRDAFGEVQVEAVLRTAM